MAECIMHSPEQVVGQHRDLGSVRPAIRPHQASLLKERILRNIDFFSGSKTGDGGEHPHGLVLSDVPHRVPRRGRVCLVGIIIDEPELIASVSQCVVLCTGLLDQLCICSLDLRVARVMLHGLEGVGDASS